MSGRLSREARGSVAFSCFSSVDPPLPVKQHTSGFRTDRAYRQLPRFSVETYSMRGLSG